MGRTIVVASTYNIHADIQHGVSIECAVYVACLVKNQNRAGEAILACKDLLYCNMSFLLIDEDHIGKFLYACRSITRSLAHQMLHLKIYRK